MPRLSFSILFVLLVQYSFGQSDFFYEDFSNGLNGATAYGAWTTEDTGTSDIWMMADENSPGGEFSNAAQALASESAENGWVIFDCDLYNTPISAGWEDVTGFLYSPVMDMTNLGSVIVEWQSVFRYCCFPASPLTVEVTNNGGTSWTVFPGYGSSIQSANTLSANPLTSRSNLRTIWDRYQSSQQSHSSYMVMMRSRMSTKWKRKTTLQLRENDMMNS